MPYCHPTSTLEVDGPRVVPTNAGEEVVPPRGLETMTLYVYRNGSDVERLWCQSRYFLKLVVCPVHLPQTSRRHFPTGDTMDVGVVTGNRTGET